MENADIIIKGMRLLREGMVRYIVREIENEYGEDWWQKGVLQILREDSRRDLPETGTKEELRDSLDLQRCLVLFDVHWQAIFRKKLPVEYRSWAKETLNVRNRISHIGANDFNYSDTWRALDTFARLCGGFNLENTEEIRTLLRDFNAQEDSDLSPSSRAIQKRTDVVLNTSDLPSWRDVIRPHQDVAQGRYKNAEFAADLAQVAKGKGSMEYLDPVEFFKRTYVTEGMKGLLVQSFRRILGMDGDPVIQLKTAFGGGKTHTMLALYHAMRARSPESLPNLQAVLDEVGVKTLPKVNVAVLVGTALDPTSARRPQNFPGITINTLWGEMAAQLAEAAGDPKLYDFVKDSDKKHASPGSEVFRKLFDACGPCLILMDELVAYGKKLYGARDLPAGTFDNFTTFIQEITEGARQSKNSLVVASIPESTFEIGGEGGKKTLEAIEHTFGRMESVWKPVSADEGFEVVRRRLFLDCARPELREMVCRRFSDMYRSNSGEFPGEAKEAEYLERMISCYPIHPEMFERLYEDWATLEHFQRTRGVLRLMAAVIHELWMAQDPNAMIMPGSLPLDVPSVRNELTRYLDDSWNPIVDKQVDGRNSEPYQQDKNTRYGKYLASRRVTRTIMLGSAPTTRDQLNRGISSTRIRLGVVQPGENIAVFNDALNSLRNTLSHLYTVGDRFWYDTRPTLLKSASDRAKMIKRDEIEMELERRLKERRNESPFSGLHICPASTQDVPDEQAVRMVILSPKATHRADQLQTLALQAVNQFLNERGTSPRIYRNTLVFVAPDLNGMESLKEAVRKFLAWESIYKDTDVLNLDSMQRRDVETNKKTHDDTVELQIKETYCWLLIPRTEITDLKNVQWETHKISGNETILRKAAQNMRQKETIIERWAPSLLRMELDQVLWKDRDDLSFGDLWKMLCSYTYLPRLANEQVLKDAVRQGLESEEFFAIADSKEGEKYVNLQFRPNLFTLQPTTLLVKPSVARAQLDAEQKAAPTVSPVPYKVPTPKGGKTEPEPKPVPKTTFFMSAELDTTRLNRNLQLLTEEIISHLLSLPNSTTEIHLDIRTTSPEGFPPDIVRTLTENCNTLKVETFGFEE